MAPLVLVRSPQVLVFLYSAGVEAEVRPVNPDEAKDISALPYDVMNRAEAKAMAEGLPHSYLRVTRAEIELDDSVDPYDPKVYAHARENLDKMIEDGVIAFDKKPCLYVYRQTMNGREQYGLVCCVPAADYFSGIIKKGIYIIRNKFQMAKIVVR